MALPPPPEFKQLTLWDDSHVEMFRMTVCGNLTCHGNELGCEGPGCKVQRRPMMTHAEYTRHYGRCPTLCKTKGAKVA